MWVVRRLIDYQEPILCIQWQFQDTDILSEFCETARLTQQIYGKCSNMAAFKLAYLLTGR